MPRDRESSETEVDLWLLDVNSEVKDGAAEIWLWGVAPGKRLLLVERAFRPYMYLVPSEAADLKKLGEEALRACERLEQKGTVQALERSHFGRRVSAIKAQFTNPEKAERLAKTLRKLSGVEEVLEDDIRLANRYLVDHEVKPCGWHLWRVRSCEKPSGVEVDAVYEVRGKPSAKERAEVPALRVMAFHALYFGRKGSPRPDRDPIAVISVSTSDGKARQFVADNGKDEKALEAFVRFVRRHDPDIVVGFGSNRRDWPYLMERAKRLGVSLAVARSGAEPHGSV
ncbi:MAG: DNA polymerase II, partial [Aigarchaeota archaeon]|nr:DNA polymerase II [Aigarchaeota archaeon]